MKDLTRREFLDVTAKGTAAAALGVSALDAVLNPNEAQAANQPTTNKSGVADQVLSLPKGGGSIKGLGEKFQPDLHTGTGNFSLPIQAPPGRSGFQPQLALSYSTGAGNGPFGLGWSMGVPNVSRKTSHGIPVYDDEEDTFILSGAEDLVPTENGYYQPRTEGLFARIRKVEEGSDSWWEVTSKNGVNSIYGDSDESRIFVVGGRRKKIFQWLLSRTEDPLGNTIVYHYNQDEKPTSFSDADLKQSEKNHDYNQVYLQSIEYMNFRENGDTADQHFNRIEFDYGEYDQEGNLVDENNWEVRPDRFSSNRAGFEIRTVRRCKQILIKVRDENVKGRYHLIRRYVLEYEQSPYSDISLLKQVTMWGHRGDDKKRFPPIAFDYTKFNPEIRQYESLQAQGNYLPPSALSDPNYELIDLTGTGLPDVIHTGEYGFRYWENKGDGFFLSPKSMGRYPANLRLEQTGVQFADMEGNGSADLLVTGGVTSGFFPTTFEGKWDRLHKYRRAPEFSFEDPNTRLVDIDGDGVIDVLRATRRGFLYYRNKGKKGWEDPMPSKRKRDLEEWPDVYLDNPRVRFADMSGDGLQDIVYIHNNRFEYWSNLGHGRWSKRHTMADAPRLERKYDPNRLFLSDVNGDGLADLIYVGFNRVTVWINQSGNRWSDPVIINGTPPTGPTSVRTADMRGTGTPGLLWTYDHSLLRPRNYKYLDFTGGEKPLLLNKIENNIGAETRIAYQPSTHFWTEDEKAGKPWKTHLPFPVQVVEKVEVFDHISKSKLVSTFKYHHGYYDGREREFRGFGLAEQLDTEFFNDYKELSLFGNGVDIHADEQIHVPPILSKTWFHTGAFRKLKDHVDFFRDEYYSGDPEAFKAHTSIERNDAPFEANRTLRGATLRSEVYALDGTDLEKHPYTITENGYHVIKVREKGGNRHAIFLTTSLESFSYHYERNPADPRITQSITHEVDEYGNITKSLEIAYPRRGDPEYDEQKEYHIVYTKSNYINENNSSRKYLIGYVCESRQIEIKLPNDFRPEPLKPSEVSRLEIDSPRHNLFSLVRTYYDGPRYLGLLHGEIGEQGLLTRSESLAYKPGQVAAVFGDKVSESDLRKAGYVEYSREPGNLWIQTQRAEYDSANYYLPIGQKDPIPPLDSPPDERVYKTEYDRFAFLPNATEDPLGNRVETKNDYLTMSPCLITDMNGNRAQVAFDPLGFVVKTAVMGKEGADQGDTIYHPTTVIEYDLFKYFDENKAIYAQVKAREEHHQVNTNPRWLETYVYSDGFGREIQTKTKAEPGMAGGNFCDNRWVGSGWKIYNNKGWIVQQFEPFFSCRFEYEAEVKQGVSSLLTYDAVGRTIRTDNPDGTFSQVTFDPWQQASHDVNDTVAESQWYVTMRRSDKPQEQKAAQKAIAHKNTPATTHLDSLGRTFLTIEDNGTYGKYQTATKFDIQGNVLQMTDPRGNVAFQHKYDMLNNVVFRWQMDSGERTLFLNAVGNPVKKWDSRHHVIETLYDDLNRPKQLWVAHKPPDETPTRRLAEKIEYGEDIDKTAAKEKNLLGQMHNQYDGAGVKTFAEYDFKGNLLRKTRQLLEHYKVPVDWSSNPALISGAAYEHRYAYDALNRIISSTYPDGSIYVPEYNDANMLNSVKVFLRGSVTDKVIIRNIDYNARGQSEKVEYGNGVTTKYEYDPSTFRLIELKSWKGDKVYQHYVYTYDPVGNITSIEDRSTRAIYFQNAVVTADREFEYDPLYRLTSATGREHAGQIPANDYQDFPRLESIPHPNDSNALRPYTRTYQYDKAGNITEMNHRGHWRRAYEYDENSNRLLKTVSGRGTQPDWTYGFNAHGNHKDFSHLGEIHWDFKDQMWSVDLNGGGKAYYLYDAGGMRVRKVVENNSAVKQKETLYLEDFEIKRGYEGGSKQEEIETLHVTDDQQRVALVETRTKPEGREEDRVPKLRYQFTNHLGSSATELSDEAIPITYEEYYPYGGTAYHATDRSLGYSTKRYRYSGKEKDEETGFYYYGARYYVWWLGRWSGCDLIQEGDGLNLYAFVGNNSINSVDPNGLEQEKASAKIVINLLEKGKMGEEFEGGHRSFKPGPRNNITLFTVIEGETDQYIFEDTGLPNDTILKYARPLEDAKEEPKRPPTETTTKKKKKKNTKKNIPTKGQKSTKEPQVQNEPQKETSQKSNRHEFFERTQEGVQKVRKEIENFEVPKVLKKVLKEPKETLEKGLRLVEAILEFGKDEVVKEGKTGKAAENFFSELPSWAQKAKKGIEYVIGEEIDIEKTVEEYLPESVEKIIPESWYERYYKRVLK